MSLITSLEMFSNSHSRNEIEPNSLYRSSVDNGTVNYDIPDSLIVDNTTTHDLIMQFCYNAIFVQFVWRK